MVKQMPLFCSLFRALPYGWGSEQSPGPPSIPLKRLNQDDASTNGHNLEKQHSAVCRIDLTSSSSAFSKFLWRPSVNYITLSVGAKANFAITNDAIPANYLNDFLWSLVCTISYIITHINHICFRTRLTFLEASACGPNVRASALSPIWGSMLRLQALKMHQWTRSCSNLQASNFSEPNCRILCPPYSVILWPAACLIVQLELSTSTIIIEMAGLKVLSPLAMNAVRGPKIVKMYWLYTLRTQTLPCIFAGPRLITTHLCDDSASFPLSIGVDVARKSFIKEVVPVFVAQDFSRTASCNSIPANEIYHADRRELKPSWQLEILLLDLLLCQRHHGLSSQVELIHQPVFIQIATPLY